MTSRFRAGYLAVLVAAGSCTDSSAPGTTLNAPAAVSARALGMRVVRVEWTPATGGIEGYRLERRVNLTGPWVVIAPTLPPVNGGALISFLDADVEPETFYGYRVFTLGALGNESRPSVVAGTITPPPPGIEVQTSSTVPVPEAADIDGYWVSVEGPAPVAAPLGVNDRRRFTPLTPGAYTVTLSGVRSSCELQDPGTRAVTVSDTGLQTVAGVSFRIVCRDPARGQIRGTVVAEGDSADPTGYRVRALGLLADTTLPDSARIVQFEQGVGAAGGTFTFAALLPGDYEVRLDDVAAHCSVAGAPVHEVTVAPLSEDSLAYTVTCLGSGGIGRPFVWRNTWSPGSAPPGTKVAVDVSLDVSATPGQQVGGVQGELRYPAAGLRFDSAKAGALADQFTTNGQTAGLVAWLAFKLSNAPTGTVPLGRFHFTVLGPAGSTANTRSTITEVLAGDLDTRIDTLVRIVEDTLAVTSGGGGSNQAPTAQANGPYTGTVGNGITLSAAGSSDPDGTIATYGWAFGDGSTATGAAPSHSYASAGAYTATLTVTDNLGANAIDQATVTVSAGGGNQAPSADANGPYSGTTGTAITFSAAGSSDADGSIASYAWAFGDGATGAGASPAHSYAAPGTYTATLTVTDNLGSTDTDQAIVTVTAAGGGTPLTWAGTFGAVNLADSVVVLTLTLDLTPDIPETPSPEALATFAVDSLKWDATVLKYWAFNWGPGGSGSVQTTHALQGKVVFSNQTALPANANSGVVTIATVRFKVIGVSGRSTTTATAVGPLIGTPATGGYNYRSKTAIVEGTFIAP